MKIFVIIPSKKIIVLPVIPCDTIINIKTKIYNQEGIPINHQQILNGKIQLENGQSLLEHNIQNNTSLILAIKESDYIQIFLKTFSGKVFTFEVQPNYTIDNIKKMIQDREGIPSDQQGLVFSKRLLKNDSTVSDCNIQNGSTLYLLIKRSHVLKNSIKPITSVNHKKNEITKNAEIKIKETNKLNKQILQVFNDIRIFIKSCSGKIIVLKVNPRNSVKSVKAKIQDKEGIAICEQKISFACMQLEDNKTLFDYGIIKESILHLSVNNIQICIKHVGDEIIYFTTEPTKTIENIKTMIQHRTDIPTTEQRLVFGCKLLENNFTLAYYKITTSAVLHLSTDFHKLYECNEISEVDRSYMKLNFSDERSNMIEEKVRKLCSLRLKLRFRGNGMPTTLQFMELIGNLQ